MTYRVATFYQFIPLPDPAGMRLKLRDFCAGLQLRGTVLLAPEGINGTLAGTPSAITAIVDALRCGSVVQPACTRLELKFSAAAQPPFRRLKIRLKREIVALGQNHADPLAAVGTYVEPADWNALLDDDRTLVIDTRNGFEVAMGSFPGAVNPQTERFSDFVGFVQTRLDPRQHQRIAMFCTGGIRCEKASAFLLAAGFADVLHLKGGILNYLETIPARMSRWQGECFVFDARVALSHQSFAETP
jgi:UPF0176 protein